VLSSIYAGNLWEISRRIVKETLKYFIAEARYLWANVDFNGNLQGNIDLNGFIFTGNIGFRFLIAGSEAADKLVSVLKGRFNPCP